MTHVFLNVGALILSGVGGSSNWFPLLYPFMALFAIVYGIDVTVKFIKRKRLQKRQLLNVPHGEAENTRAEIDGN